MTHRPTIDRETDPERHESVSGKADGYTTMENSIMSLNGNTILMVTPAMLQDFACTIIEEARTKLVKEEEPSYTPAEFAKRWRVDKSTLWRWVRNGKLKKTIVGGKVFYKDSDLKKEGEK